MSGDAQAGAGDRFAVLVVQVGRYGLDGFAVQSGAGEIGQVGLCGSLLPDSWWSAQPVPRGSGSSAVPVQPVQPRSVGGLLVLLDKGQQNVDTHVRTSLQIVG